MKPRFQVFTGRAALEEGAAGLIAAALAAARRTRPGRPSLALCGGASPRGLYELLASPAWTAALPWSELEVFFTDERCVGPEHPDSNYAMIQEALLSKVPVRPESIHRILGELPAEEAARRYETELRSAGGCEVALLGAGADGHTASLFPGSSLLEERRRWAAAALTPLGPRVTMTLPYLDSCRSVFVYAPGPAKAGLVRRVRSQPEGLLPVQRLSPAEPPLWLLDEDAAEGPEAPVKTEGRR